MFNVILAIHEVPAYFTSDARYRDFFSGAGYIMPWWMLSCLYQQGLKLPYFFLEDVFLTGWIGNTWIQSYCALFEFLNRITAVPVMMNEDKCGAMT